MAHKTNKLAKHFSESFDKYTHTTKMAIIFSLWVIWTDECYEGKIFFSSLLINTHRSKLYKLQRLALSNNILILSKNTFWWHSCKGKYSEVAARLRFEYKLVYYFLHFEKFLYKNNVSWTEQHGWQHNKVYEVDKRCVNIQGFSFYKTISLLIINIQYYILRYNDYQRKQLFGELG